MIKKDTKVMSCFAVGTRHIGDCWEHDEKWNTNQDYGRKVLLQDVLKEVGLSTERYVEYLSLFKETGSKRVSYCPDSSSWTRIIVGSSGIGVSGCLTSININGDGAVPKTDIQPSYSTEITPLTNGWYINHDCT